MIYLETERLVLRNVKMQDADIMHDYRNNPVCARYQRGQTKDYAGIVELLRKREKDLLGVEEPSLVAVALKESDELVGEIVVMPNDGTISLGYTFSYKHHRKGYAFEALSKLIDVLHKDNPAWDFISFTEPENTASRNLLKKLGYRDLGYLPSMESQAYGKWTTPETEAEIAQVTGRRMDSDIKEKRLEYIQLYKDNLQLCAVFSALMRQYIAEMNEHSHRPLPEEFQQKWIDSIISMQGPKDRHLELCYDGEELVGFLYGKVDHADHRGYIKPGYGYIMEFYVKPELRRKGYGTRMFRRLEELFKTDGTAQMYLTADPVTGRPFWEAIGFANTGECSPENQLFIYEKTVEETD